MVMASNCDLKDLVTCAVCMATYTDPQQLPCLHSFCHTCITSLVIQDTRSIRCPCCRRKTDVADHQHDFKTAQLVDIYKQRKSKKKRIKLSHDQDDLCQLCGCNDINLVCHKCSGYFCEACSEEHRKYTACQETDAEDLKVVSESCLNKLQDHDKCISELFSDIKEQFAMAMQQCEEEKKKAKFSIEQYSSKIMEHCKKEKKKIEKIADEHAEKLREEGMELRKQRRDMKELLLETEGLTPAGVVKRFASVNLKIMSKLDLCRNRRLSLVKIEVGNDHVMDQELITVTSTKAS